MEAVIDGIPCQGGGPASYVEFHPNGRLWWATLARDHRLDGRTLAAGTFLELDPSGHLIYVARGRRR